MVVCPSCQHEFEAAESFAGLCPYCGWRVNPAPRPANYVPTRLSKTFENNTAYYIQHRAYRQVRQRVKWVAIGLSLLGMSLLLVWGTINWLAVRTDLQAPAPVSLLPLPVVAADWLPVEARTYYQAGLVALPTDAVAAEQSFQKSVAVYPPNIPARHQLGFMYLNTNRLAEALTIYLAIIKFDPTDVQALINIGLIYERQGQPLSAEEYLRRALDIRPDPEIEQRLQTIQAKLRS